MLLKISDVEAGYKNKQVLFGVSLEPGPLADDGMPRRRFVSGRIQLGLSNHFGLKNSGPVKAALTGS